MSVLVRALASAKALFAVLLLMSLGIVIGLMLGTGLNGSNETISATPASPQTVSVSPLAEESLESPFVSVAQKVLPGVVNVDTKRKVTYKGFNSDQGPYGEFFRRLFPDMPDREVEVPTYGSGFIFDQDGHIMTNNHVVSDAEEITVTLNDGTQYDATLVGRDPATDVAVIKIEPEGSLPALSLGDSDAMKVGEWVAAVGNPFHELEGTLTVGVVSAKGRSDLRIAGGAPVYQSFIQTDASINYGNSGGPLCNVRGEVIGINAAINPSGQGIGFAIPINLAKKIGDQLIAGGEVVRGYLGVLPQALTDDLAEGLGLEGQKGVVVGSVEKGTPAEEAGLEEGDIILTFDGAPVDDVDQFRMLVADTPVDSTVPIKVLRGGKEKTLTAKLVRRPEDLASSETNEPETEDWLGVEVHPVDSDVARELDVDEGKGVVILSVRGASPAESAGLDRGDIILSVGDTEVSSVRDFERALRDAHNESMKESEGRRRAKPIVFLVERQGRTMFVPIRPPMN
jgi:serine protease Do